jgi:putative molybdopterin biosynthesis protein
MGDTMMQAPLTRLRHERGLSQAGLAQVAGISRQSLHQIETARSVPGVDVALRLARALGCSVEELFGDRTELELQTELWGTCTSTRVAVAKIGDRFMSYPLTADQHAVRADGLIQSTTAQDGTQLNVQLLVPQAEVEQHLVLQGCSPALGLLTNHYTHSTRPGRALWLAGSNADALSALHSGKIHVAAVHEPEAFEHPVASKNPRKKPGYHAVSLGHWHLGLISRKPPKSRVLSVSDLSRAGLRVANRAAGARAQQLLEQQLKRSGLPISLGRVSTLQMPSHLAMAEAIAHHRADVGIASLDCALHHDLHFVPLVRERIDLVYATRDTAVPAFQRLFQLVTEYPLRRELESLGYETAQAGQTHVRECT